MTELNAARTRRARTTFAVHALLLKNASVRNCSIGCAHELSSTGRDRAAAHVPLPRITMSKSRPKARTSTMPEKRRRPQDGGPAGGVEGVYRQVVPACQTVNEALLPNLFAVQKGHGPSGALALSKSNNGEHRARIFPPSTASRSPSPMLRTGEENAGAFPPPRGTLGGGGPRPAYACGFGGFANSPPKLRSSEGGSGGGAGPRADAGCSTPIPATLPGGSSAAGNELERPGSGAHRRRDAATL
jgi:hypothetical protein